MSTNIHDNENAFLILSQVGPVYEVRFGCYRYCNKDFKTKRIGDIFVDSKEIKRIIA